MASRGSTKWLSQRQEEHVAKIYGGVRSLSSGAKATDPGDVRELTTLFECKTTGTFDKPAKSISVKLADLEKIADEAWSLGRNYALALRIYAPGSILADSDGNVDLVVRAMLDDRARIPDGEV